MPNVPIMYTVPLGTASRKCGCGRIIHFLEKARVGGGVTRTPIDCGVEGGHLPSREAPGRGVNHFTNCALADTYRKKARVGGQA